MRKVRLDLTLKDYEKLHFATTVLSEISNNPQFNNLVRNTYGNVSDNEIKDTIVNPISTVTQMVYVAKRSDPNSPPKLTFFTTPMQATDRTNYLYNILYTEHKLPDLIYDQIQTTCISDIKSMIHRYGKVDKLLLSLCPKTSPTEINNKTVIDMAKEMSDWSPKF